MQVPEQLAMFLQEGETVLACMKGNSYTTSHNPIIRLLMVILWVRNTLLGFGSRTTVVCTDRRVLLESTDYVLFVIERASEVVAIAPSAIGTVGYQFLRMLFVIPSYGIALGVNAGGGEDLIVISREGKAQVIELVRAIELMRVRLYA